MITWFMRRMGWNTLWYASRGPCPILHAGPRWMAGIWTGPDEDLVCLQRCETASEAEKCLSPAGWTPLDAVLRAVYRFRVLRLPRHDPNRIPSASPTTGDGD